MWVLLFGDVVVDVLLRAGVQFRKNSEFLCHRMKLKLRTKNSEFWCHRMKIQNFRKIEKKLRDLQNSEFLRL